MYVLLHVVKDFEWYARCVTKPESTMYSETATWPREKKREVSPRGSAAK